MKETLTILRPGTHVNMRASGIAGVVQQVCVSHADHITYQVTWWSGCDRKTEWVEAHEVEPDGNAQYTHLGFRPA